MKVDPLPVLLILISFALALYLYLISFLGILVYVNPQWPVITLIYWILAIPERISVTTSIGLGLILSIVDGSVLGFNSLALLFVHFVCLIGYQRFRVFTIFQQCLLVFGIISGYLLVFHWLHALSKQSIIDSRILFSAISSAIVWPFVFSALHSLRRRLERA